MWNFKFQGKEQEIVDDKKKMKKREQEEKESSKKFIPKHMRMFPVLR